MKLFSDAIQIETYAMYMPESVRLNCADDSWKDNYLTVFEISKAYAESFIQGEGVYAGLDDFHHNYTWDDTERLYLGAQRDGQILHSATIERNKL